MRHVCDSGGLSGIRNGTEAADKLQQEPELGGSLRFAEAEVEVWVNDRLLAPNTPETFAAFEEEVALSLSNRLGGTPKLARSTDPRDLVRVRTVGAGS